jgi:hypothetical protein
VANTGLQLSAADIERIRAEEIYRDEVRREIEDRRAHGVGSRTWAFLNSAFGLWLLTTVVVSIGTWGFTEWRNAREMSRENDRAIVSLNREIAVRLDQFAIKMPTGNPYAISTSDQYRNRALSSLMRELWSRLPKAERDMALAIKGAQRLARISATNVDRREHPSATDDNSIDLKQREEVLSILRGPLRLARWPASYESGLN